MMKQICKYCKGTGEIETTFEDRQFEFQKDVAKHSQIFNMPANMAQEFFEHWSESNKGGTKMKWEMEKTWSLALRIQKWQRNDKKWNPKKTEVKQKYDRKIASLRNRTGPIAIKDYFKRIKS